jgi:hypothetical protein
MRTPSSRRLGAVGGVLAPGDPTPPPQDSTARVLAFGANRRARLGDADANAQSEEDASPALAKPETKATKAKTKSPAPSATSSRAKTNRVLPPSPSPARRRDAARRDENENHLSVERLRETRDRGDADAVAHLREGTKRWFVTARDETKEIAWWQIATTKATRRADVAEARLRTLESVVDELRAAVERERDDRVRVESVLRDAFDEPVVRDALRAFPEDADTPHDDDGSVVAARVFRALERRVAGDAEALEAARTRETYLAERLRDAETAKLGAFAAAHKAREELKAHVTRLRVDNELRKEAQGRLESNDADARELPVVRQQLLFARSELERLKENDENRAAIQSRAVADAVAQALRTRHDEAHAENLRLREALRVARTERGEADWEHARARESAEQERVAAMRGVTENAAQLAELLRAQTRETRHADSERARVAEEAGRAVERAISQREWALEVLDREVEAQEAFGKKLAYEMYLASLHAMPETAVRAEEEEDVAGFARAVAAEHRSASEKLRELARALHEQVKALPHIRQAARAAGVAAGWTAALAMATAATAKAGPREWPATNRLREQIKKGREDARREASRGAARRGVLQTLGLDLEPLCEASGKATIERLMMPSEPSLKQKPETKTPREKNVGDARAVPGTPGTFGTDHFYDAETPTTFATSSFRARDYFYDAETERTPERDGREATTPFATPAGAEGGDAARDAPAPEPPEAEADWIARAREAAATLLARRTVNGRRREMRHLETADSGWGEILAGSPATPGTSSASTKKRLAFRTPESTTPFATPSATVSCGKAYAPSKPAQREIDALVKSLSFAK